MNDKFNVTDFEMGMFLGKIGVVDMEHLKEIAFGKNRYVLVDLEEFITNNKKVPMPIPDIKPLEEKVVKEKENVHVTEKSVLETEEEFQEEKETEKALKAISIPIGAKAQVEETEIKEQQNFQFDLTGQPIVPLKTGYIEVDESLILKSASALDNNKKVNTSTAKSLELESFVINFANDQYETIVNGMVTTHIYSKDLSKGKYELEKLVLAGIEISMLAVMFKCSVARMERDYKKATFDLKDLNVDNRAVLAHQLLLKGVNHNHIMKVLKIQDEDVLKNIVSKVFARELSNKGK